MKSDALGKTKATYANSETARLIPLEKQLAECKAELTAAKHEAREIRMQFDDKRAELDHENQLLTDERSGLVAELAEARRCADAALRLHLVEINALHAKNAAVSEARDEACDLAEKRRQYNAFLNKHVVPDAERIAALRAVGRKP